MNPFISFITSEEFCGISFMIGCWMEGIWAISLQLGWLEIAIGFMRGAE